MSDILHTTVPLLFENMMNTYLPSIDSNAFDAVYPPEMIKRIHDTFSKATRPAGGGDKDDLVKEEIISKAWYNVHKNETLCPGYLLNISETKQDGTDSKKYRIDGALIPDIDEELIDEGRPNYMLGDLGIEFKRGGTANDAWNDHPKKDVETDAYTRTGVRGQLMSYGERFFYFQHRTGLFMLLVNGDEFRVIRWDRSGCIVTELLNYVNTTEHTKKLLQFLYAFSKATPAQRGVDVTAIRLSKDSCGWQWMQKVAAAHPQDIDHAEGTVVAEVPPGFIVKPTQTVPPSPLFARNVLVDDPAATTGLGDLSSTSAISSIIPVFKYVRNFFRGSITGTWLPYRLNVCGRDYLVGEPIFGPHGLIGRATRGYVALEWDTQRLVFLKDTWRPFYDGVAQEGETLAKLNLAEVSSVPTLICHEDVGGPGAQETEASQYSSTGKKTRDVFGNRPIAPMPGSRPRASGSGASTASRARQSSGSGRAPQAQTSSGSNGKRPANAAKAGKTNQGSSGGRSGKRPRPEDTVPAVPKDGFGLRHLTHYRMVVAEVCLSSTDIMSGEQLVQIVWNCMFGHRDAVVKCGILHRDVSSGNILIRPELVCADSKAGNSGSVVFWRGILSDWELAKDLPVEGKAVIKARQPHRTGTWYYMSVYSLTYPGHPVSIADELESFFHVLLYLAVRFLWTNFSNAGTFMDSYFDAFELDNDNRAICGLLKEKIIQSGTLMWNTRRIYFLAEPPKNGLNLQQQDASDSDSERLSPLNDILLKLLAYFKARYAVLGYERQASEGQPKSLPSLESMIEAATPSSSAAAAAAWKKQLRVAEYEASGFVTPTVADANPASAPSEPTVLEKPSQAVYDMAAKLASHDAVLGMLAREVNARVWPTADFAGDRLEGHVPRQLQSTAKRARVQRQSAMQSIPEGQELPSRPHTAS